MSEYSEDRIDLYADDKIVDSELSFVVDDDQKAEWCIRKIADAKKEMMDWIEFYVEQTDKVKAKCEARIQFFEGMLQRYFESVPHKETKTQSSYQLPSGKLVLKKQTVEWVHDDAALLPWVKKNVPNMIKIKESVDWAGLKSVFKEDDDYIQSNGALVNATDGEVIPGITVTERPDVFKVEVK